MYVWYAGYARYAGYEERANAGLLPYVQSPATSAIRRH
jgi:hypothetical protein